MNPDVSMDWPPEAGAPDYSKPLGEEEEALIEGIRRGLDAPSYQVEMASSRRLLSEYLSRRDAEKDAEVERLKAGWKSAEGEADRQRERANFAILERDAARAGAFEEAIALAGELYATWKNARSWALSNGAVSLIADRCGCTIPVATAALRGVVEIIDAHASAKRADDAIAALRSKARTT